MKKIITAAVAAVATTLVFAAPAGADPLDDICDGITTARVSGVPARVLFTEILKRAANEGITADQVGTAVGVAVATRCPKNYDYVASVG